MDRKGEIAGIDAGSISVKIVLLDGNGEVLLSRYERHGGRSQDKMLEMLEQLIVKHPSVRLAFTGSAGRMAAAAMGAPFVSELASFSLAASKLHPEVHTVIEMGGEDSKLLFLDDSGISDFALNSVCAAGTGSFLDQQAERMNLSIEQFAELALGSKHPPRIAGRCSVFAKSDMIHLQQIATPLEDIVAGLCFAVARNFKGSIVRGRPLEPKVAFMGGVALNRGMVRAFREIFELDELVIPDNPVTMGALGAAIKARRDSSAAAPDMDRFRSKVRELSRADRPKAPLIQAGDRFRERHMEESRDPLFHPDGTKRRMDEPVKPPEEPVEAYLGIDVGSISTNLAIIDRQGRLLGKRYLMTASRPIQAVQTGLAELREELGPHVNIKGAGTTGSGRYMIADFTAADVVKNEITAHARASAFIDPNVDTIFEIGGQDSKYVSLEKGVIADFTMNKACAAGTGSFLEEQAEKLSVRIKGEFQDLALSAEEPARLGERCTVFMENSLMSSLSLGTGKEDLLAGLAYSIVENYVNRVVEGRRIGENIFFQGGTAFNKAVAAAFEKYVGREITVPPNHDVAGAIGMALIARDHMAEQGLEESTFKGFDLAELSYKASSFTCKGCENRCEINRLRIEGQKGFLFYGGRCEKYDVARDEKPEGERGDRLFVFRENELKRAHKNYLADFRNHESDAEKGRIGLPYSFFMHDYLPYYSTLLWELGFEPVIADQTNRAITKLGVETVLAETCYPLKAALGHVRHLIENEGVSTVFVPSFINTSPPDSKYSSGLACPLTQSYPYQALAAFPEADVVAPPLSPRFGDKGMHKALLEHLRRFGVKSGELKRAMQKAGEAQKSFEDAIKDRGRKALANLGDRAVVIIGRPYNAFDPGLNLDVPKKLASLGVTAIPMDFLPEEDIYDDWPEMYWRSGQRMLSAARTARKDERLYPLFIGSFSCGPDSFIFKYIEHELSDKPDLHLEIDEHSADAGIITRVEAFLDSIDGNIKAGDEAPAGRTAEMHRLVKPEVTFARKVWLPPMTDHAYGLEAAFRYCGADAEVMPVTDPEAVSLAKKYVSGKECYPFAVTTGDMLKKASESDFDPDRSAFFMPSGCGPCRFGQYNTAQRMVLDRAGLSNVPIYAPMQDVQFYEDLGMVGGEFPRVSWENVIAFDLLVKCLHETRPYEANHGETDAVYLKHLELLREGLAAPDRDPNALLEAVRRDFEKIEKTHEKRPLIGVVGEIFVRSNKFSNEDSIRKIEKLGGEAWLAPIDEWFFYTNAMAIRRALKKGHYKSWLKLKLKDRVQHKITHEMEGVFEGLLKTIHDPDTYAVMQNAEPYIHDSLEGEAILSIGKSVDMIRRGCVGIVNLMPFGCMPGTVVSALMRRVADEYGVPSISLPFDGTESAANRLQIEAFMEQCMRRTRRQELEVDPTLLDN